MQRISIIIITVFCLQTLQAETPQTSENTFLFCLKPNIQPLEITKRDGELTVNIEELNNLFRSHQVKDIEPWIKHATEMDRDGDIYLNRIYRVYLNEERSIPIEQTIASIHDVFSPYMRKMNIYENHYIHPMILP